MALIHSNRRGRRNASLWQDDDIPGRSDSVNKSLRMLDVTKKEEQLLLHLRMLEAGAYSMNISKTSRGRIGLKEFRVQEVLNE